jgi:quinol monooxygenase YgiN
MDGKPVTVIARVKAKSGREAEVLRELMSLVAPSRKDAGCINYDLHRSQADAGCFLFHENWESREHLDRHLAKPDLQATIAGLGQLVAEPPEISLWDKIALAFCQPKR